MTGLLHWLLLGLLLLPVLLWLRRAVRRVRSLPPPSVQKQLLQTRPQTQPQPQPQPEPEPEPEP